MTGERTTKLEGEIINPSDKCFIDITDKKAAYAAVLFLGNGKYGLEGEGCDLPLFLFGGAVEWWEREFGETLDAYMTDHKADVADALDSVELAGERTSMNDIMGRAKAYAKGLR